MAHDVYRDEWNTARPVDQWLAVLRHAVAIGTLQSSPPISQSMVRWLTAQLGYENRAPQPVVVPPDETDPNRFFASRHRAILKAIPIALWPELLGNNWPLGRMLHEAVLQRTTQVAQRWLQISSLTLGAVDDHRREFASFVAHSLSWKAIEPVEVDGEKLLCVAPAGSSIDLPQKLPVIFTGPSDTVADAESAFAEAKDLQDAVEKKIGSRVVINVVTGATHFVDSYLQCSASARDLVLLHEQRLKRVFLSERLNRAFNEVFHEDLGLARLNPYTTSKPVERPEMFFGRQAEIRTIQDQPWRDYMLIGTRQIGKTSLCRYLERQSKAAGDRVPIYLDLAPLATDEAIIRALTLHINPHRSERMSVGRFQQMVETTFSVNQQRYSIYLDEVDAFLLRAKSTGDWRLLHILRALSQKQIIQTVFTGYRVLYEQWMSLSSPMFNYATPVYISILDMSSAMRLITEPLKSIGVHYRAKDEDRIVKHIIRQTGRFPSFLQFVCSSLLTEIDQSAHRRREIALEDVEKVERSRSFNEFVLRPFLQKDNLGDLDKLIILLVAKDNRYIFDIEWVLAVLKDKGLDLEVAAVDATLANLEIAGLILRLMDGDLSLGRRGADDRSGKVEVQYQISMPAFPRVLRAARPVDAEIAQLIRSMTGGRRA